jgi:hypothetical protein
LNKMGHRATQGGEFHKVAVHRIIATCGYTREAIESP